MDGENIKSLGLHQSRSLSRRSTQSTGLLPSQATLHLYQESSMAPSYLQRDCKLEKVGFYLESSLESLLSSWFREAPKDL